MNKSRQKKLLWVVWSLVGAIIAVALIVYAIGEQTDYYYDPTAISEGRAPQQKRIRAGGMVVVGSIQRSAEDPLNVQFKITDFKNQTPVVYRGVLPDLFAENSGVVATGQLQGDTFVASEVLAKHDENYMPPEVAKSLKEEHKARGTDVSGEQFMPATPMHELDTLAQPDSTKSQ